MLMFLCTVRRLKANQSSSSLFSLDVTATWYSSGAESCSCRTWMLARKPKINTSHKLFMRRRLKKWLKKKSAPVCVRLKFKSVSLLKLEKPEPDTLELRLPSRANTTFTFWVRLKSSIMKRGGGGWQKERKSLEFWHWGLWSLHWIRQVFLCSSTL